ncbi:hypothetical protein COU61_04465 [Candidatus Pacearchaeota archaeon CG10_big_fil_rev_8_21_14_0_10_35_13]|nr:MAG: hypothetical protein COU61_04465 [Candidatus Pacearchaeota archaeon CG10_big_fil_rev_8_21_14_0_10_35_13]
MLEIITSNYLRALVVAFVTLIVLRVLYFIIERITLKLTIKTKTDLDDLIIQKSSKPVTFLVLILSINLGIKELLLDNSVSAVILWIYQSLLIVSVAYIIHSIVDIMVSRSWKKRSRANRGVIRELSSFILGVLKVVLIILVAVYILHLWGVEITPIIAGLGIAGLAVALALQPTLSNVFSGMSVILDQTIMVGDLVYLDSETKGVIERIGLRSTRIKNFDNEMIIVPNSKIAEGKIQNVALPEEQSRVVIEFGIAYGSDIEKVKKLVLKEIKTIKNFIEKPEPVVRFTEMGDSALKFKAYFYVDSYENRFLSIDEANTKIYNVLNKNKISIPFPQMDVHIKK